MCLAIPGKIIRITGDRAEVDFGDGTKREVDISLVDVKVGQYVIVHAGFAIEVIDERHANETLKLWDDLLRVM
ncbi:MAG: HypC/HybG/HupF family hydrogenase formation chaperone [Candidatus Bathyarchaeia archaeon]|nr:HypC/HybG/HupF family hydrogenase formation chaperone [Candidatus Bathyarchaeota archaeon]